MSVYICAFYHFLPLENLSAHKESLKAKAEELGVLGIFILGPEGINSTCSAPSPEARENWMNFLKTYFQITLEGKYSESTKPAFKRFSLKIRPEICTTRGQRLQADHRDNNHLSPKEWNTVLKEEKDWVLLDTRNWYEYEMGTFKQALNPQTDKFSDFFDQVDKLQVPKDKKILIFCTGGIRCHKGINELQDRGYDNVFQLRGGILKYLEEFPQDQFEGECFVFDHRVAVDQTLSPSEKFGLCPHCGNPAQIRHSCIRCGTEAFLCEPCGTIPERKATCSKNCAHHYLIHPERRVKDGRTHRPKVVPAP